MKFDYAIVKNPEIYKVNVLPAHSDHVNLDGNGQDAYRYFLNGYWKFQYAVNYESSPKDFWKSGFDVMGWDDIKVPGHIQMQGWDKPAYINVQYPWDGREEIKPGEIPTQFNPTGCYVKDFEIPNGMKDKPLFVCFEGIESGFALWFNGQYIGYSEDSFTPSAFDLSKYVVKGTNRIAVQVFKWTSSSWCEDQDMYRFSGIFRNVYLYTEPLVNVYDLKVVPLVNGEDGKILVSLDYKGSEKNCSKAEVAVSYQDKLIFQDVYVEGVKEFAILLKDIHLWSAEDPSLYTLTLKFYDQKGNCCEIIHQNIGFRSFVMDQEIMKLNGKRIVFKGVNRHEFSCDHGRVPDPLQIEKDVQLMKRANINALRTSHYNNAHYIYDYCDRYGIYMIAENNMETHGIFDQVARGKLRVEEALPGDNEKWRGMLLDRINSTYQVNKNHPSILIWSVGNESYGGSVIHDMAQLFRKLDPYRLVHYEGIFHDRRYNDTSDMESQMYTTPQGVKKWLKDNKEKPLILCEYAHSMGNSTGNLSEYTNLAYQEDRFQGGFIWDFADQSIRTKNCFGEWYQAYGGDHEERPTDYDFSGDGLLTGEHKPYAKFQEVKYCYQGIQIEAARDMIRILNHNLFTSTDAYDGWIVLLKEGREIQRQPFNPHVAAMSDKMIRNPFQPKEQGEYTVRVLFTLKEDALWASKGYEVAFGEGTYQIGKKTFQHNGKMRIIHGAYNLGIEGEHWRALFSYERCGLVSYVYGGKEMLRSIPRLNFWRAPVSNDIGNQMPQRLHMWKINSLYQTTAPFQFDEKSGWKREYSKPEIKEQNNCVSITYQVYLPAGQGAVSVVTYCVYGDGTIHIAIDLDGKNWMADLPEFGMLFTMSSEYDHLKWYGKGPWETYCDREDGAKLGIYQMNTSETIEPYLVPQESGNHTHVRYGQVTDHTGRGLQFMASNLDGMTFSAIPYTPEQLEEAKHPYELPRQYQTVVRCSLKQMGVGGDDSWGASVHDAFLLKPNQPYHFEFEIKGI